MAHVFWGLALAGKTISLQNYQIMRIWEGHLNTCYFCWISEMYFSLPSLENRVVEDLSDEVA